MLLSLTALTGCTKDKNNGPDVPPVNTDTTGATVYITKGDQSRLFDKAGTVSFRKQAAGSAPVITVDTAVTFQEIEGFGAALTGSSAYLLNRIMSAGARGTLLNSLFNPETGIGISYLRLTIGASDFSLSDFSYDDMPAGQEDFSLTHFNLSEDTLDVIPMAKEILAINPQMVFMGSPWSPPAWMKTNRSMIGGKLRPECYDVYADYFIKYIQSMGENGIRIDAITPQNEPLHWTASYPCMEMQPEEQLTFIRDHLGPKFQSANVATKIILYDHNFDRPDYPITILNDPQAKQYVTGSAFHAYGGQVGAMSTVHNAHPDKGLYFTEISGGAWADNFSENLMWNMQNIFIGTTRNWSKNVLLWNLALDENYGPQNNGCSNCRGVVTINSGSGMVTKNVEYYSLAHFAKFVRPGALRIRTTIPQELGNVQTVAFQNTDGSKVLVAANVGNEDHVFNIKQGEKYITYTIQSKSVITVIW